jgi:hypothetical protein
MLAIYLDADPLLDERVSLEALQSYTGSQKIEMDSVAEKTLKIHHWSCSFALSSSRRCFSPKHTVLYIYQKGEKRGKRLLLHFSVLLDVCFVYAPITEPRARNKTRL